MTSSAVTDALKTMRVRYSGAPDLILLSDLIVENRLTDFLLHQYPDAEQPGRVQFIPEVRGFSASDRNPGITFLKKEVHQQRILDKHGSNIAGAEHEIKVQDAFASLRNSEILNGRSLVIFHNVKSETIRHPKLKKAWQNEFDLIVCDTFYGVFVCEIKQRAYTTLKDGKGKKYNLGLELEKQEHRYQLLSQVRKFYDKELPIHTVLFCKCNAQDIAESRLIEEEIVERSGQEYKFVVELNLSEEFSSVWSTVLGKLTCVAAPITLTDNIMGFTSLLYAMQSIDELSPAALHNKFVKSEFQQLAVQKNDGKKGGGKRKNNPGMKKDVPQSHTSILWSKEQSNIIEYVDNCFRNGGVVNSNNMRLCISGCMGSGKTLLLLKFIEIFANKFPSSQILFLIGGSPHFTLLLEKLRSCNVNDNITFAGYNKYMYASSTYKCTFLESSAQYKLIVIDEYYIAVELDTSNVKDSHIALTTSYSDTGPGFDADFKTITLAGSLRSTKDITDYVLKKQNEQNTHGKPVHVSTVHNISYRPVITTRVLTGEQCVKECMECLMKVLGNYQDENIMLIAAVHRVFLHRISELLKDENIQHAFSIYSTIPGSSRTSSSSDNNACNSNIVLCNHNQATGCESCTVLFVCDKDTVSITKYAAGAVSRATTQAFVFEIATVYNEDITILLPALPPINMPCYEHVGRKNTKEFVQYLKSIADNELMGWYKLGPLVHQNKKILITYYAVHTATISNVIKKALPAELEQFVVFVNDNSAASLSLDLSQFILHLEATVANIPGSELFTSSSTLPVKVITLHTGTDTDTDTGTDREEQV